MGQKKRCHFKRRFDVLHQVLKKVEEENNLASKANDAEMISNENDKALVKGFESLNQKNQGKRGNVLTVV